MASSPRSIKSIQSMMFTPQEAQESPAVFPSAPDTVGKLHDAFSWKDMGGVPAASSYMIASCCPQELLNWAGVGVARFAGAGPLPCLSRSQLRMKRPCCSGYLSISNICFGYASISLHNRYSCMWFSSFLWPYQHLNDRKCKGHSPRRYKTARHAVSQILMGWPQCKCSPMTLIFMYSSRFTALSVKTLTAFNTAISRYSQGQGNALRAQDTEHSSLTPSSATGFTLDYDVLSFLSENMMLRC